MDRVKQGNFLALCLLDALDDNNEKICCEFLINHKTDPNQIVYDRGIAAIHYVCGMENVDIANKIMQIMLEYGGNPNLPTVDDKMTPMHISAMYGRIHIFNLLLEKGGNVNQEDALCRIPIHYAIFEEHFEIVKRIQSHVTDERLKKPLSNSARKTRKVTKKSANEILDIASPFNKISDNYEKMINKDSISLENIETTDNIFTLTKENLSELSKRMSPRKSTKSLVDSWREKVQRSKSRKSIIATFDNVDSLLTAYMTDDHLNFSNTDLNEHNSDGKIHQNLLYLKSTYTLYSLCYIKLHGSNLLKLLICLQC
ncbi:ANKLE1.2 family protein [Megaselia abdita]